MKKKDIVKSKIDFNKIIKTGKSVSNNCFVIYYTDNNIDHSRYGISVGTKLGNAVFRNKYKRKIRMIITTNKNVLEKENKDYISDFKIYCDVVGNCLKKNDKRTESMLFTYLLRIGINMFKQYGKENDKMVLTDIYKKSIETAHSGKVARACTANKLLYLFYLTCSVLLAHNRLTLCVKIINLAPKK